MLEHHADVAAYGLDLLQVVGKLGAIDHNAALLVLFQPIDATYHRRLARPRGAANNNTLAGRDIKIDIAQHMELPIPFIDICQADNGTRNVSTYRKRGREGQMV